MPNHWVKPASSHASATASLGNATQPSLNISLFTEKNPVAIKWTSTHKSAKTHAGDVFMTRDLDLWPFDPKINEFPVLTAEHFYVKLGDPRCIGFWDAVWKKHKRRCKSYTQDYNWLEQQELIRRWEITNVNLFTTISHVRTSKY